MFATGSSSGVVNIYRRLGDSFFGSAEDLGAPRSAAILKPLKSLMHLTTVVDSLAFNWDTQVLAMASRMQRDALRLVHLPSATVFSNWPTTRSPLHYVHSLCFSPGGGYLAVGNAKGRVLLYRLHHYKQA
jgi:U3 small nucleolar RNA-associated protein 18